MSASKGTPDLLHCGLKILVMLTTHEYVSTKIGGVSKVTSIKIETLMADKSFVL